MLVIKCELVSGGIAVSSEVSVCGNVCKGLRANASPTISMVSVIYSASYAYVHVTRVCIPTTIVQL